MLSSTFALEIREHIVWLNHVLFEYKLFYYDLWSLVHLWSGAVLFTILSLLNVKKIWLKMLLLLSLFEVVEATFFIAVLNIFQPEKTVDVFNDIFIGILGGYMIYGFFRWNKKREYSKWFAVFLSSITIAFLWVGFYGYNYNIPFFNSNGINWWALCCWFFSGFAIILFFRFLKDKKSIAFSILATWLIYVILLFVLEYIAFHIICFREISENTKPLIFNIIHGSSVMHFFYVTAPLYFIGLFILFSYMFEKYENLQISKK